MTTAYDKWRELPKDTPFGKRLDALAEFYDEFVMNAMPLEIVAISNLSVATVLQAKATAELEAAKKEANSTIDDFNDATRDCGDK